jgi:hypothetical protein
VSTQANSIAGRCRCTFNATAPENLFSGVSSFGQMVRRYDEARAIGEPAVVESKGPRTIATTYDGLIRSRGAFQ